MDSFALLQSVLLGLVERVAVLHFGDGLPGSMEIVEECGDRPGVPAEESPAPLCPPLRGAAAQAVERR